jgi:hypothetical protein
VSVVDRALAVGAAIRVGGRGAVGHGLSDQSADDLVEGPGLAGLVMAPATAVLPWRVR